METRNIQFIAEACDGDLRGISPEATVRSICTDSRAIHAGDLFVAVPGDRFDGHDFVEEVLRRGAVGAVVRREKALGPCIAVPDTRVALGKIAARYARDFELHRVAIAGSNGKTTTKELVASVLAQKFETIASAGSFNNDVGVPLTLLRLEREHQAGVFEVGTNHPGELRPLLNMVQPGIGVVTSIGREHLEFFNGLEGVLEEEGTMADVLPPGGLLVIHGDGYGAEALRRRGVARVLSAGYGAQNDWRIAAAHFDLEGTHFSLRAPKEEYSGNYSIQLLGTHQALNAVYAIIIGAELGLRREEIEAGLRSCRGAKMRLQLRRINDFLVLDDAYNANADSVNAALETLHKFPCTGRRIAVLGDMAELGPASIPAHEEVGRNAAERGLDWLVAVGRNASIIAGAARGAGLRNVVETPGAEIAGPAIKELVRSGDVVLVKASRSARLERVIDYLVANFGTK